MVLTGKIIIRIVFILCFVLLIISDYSGLFNKLIGGNRTNNKNNPPKPTNPGYGDSKTDIDIDADIEEESVRHIGKLSRFQTGFFQCQDEYPILILNVIATQTARSQILQTIKNACLPKLICELTATPQKEKLTETEKSLLNLLR